MGDGGRRHKVRWRASAEVDPDDTYPAGAVQNASADWTKIAIAEPRVRLSIRGGLFMSAEEIGRALFTLAIGAAGGLIVAAFNWFTTALAAARQRELAHVQDQLRYLYGPLYRVVIEGRQLIGHAKTHQDAILTTFKERSDVAGDPELGPDVAARSMAICQAYDKERDKLNAAAQAAVEQHFHLAEPADQEVLVAFRVDQIRAQVELYENRRNQLHPHTLVQLEGIPSQRPEFVECVERRFKELQDRHRELTNRGSRLRSALGITSHPYIVTDS
jgi:hypothetical protein